jgi:hypothetical protein
MAVLFDTLKLAERLEASGLPPRQARDMAAAFAETMTGDVATRQDLELLRRDIDQTRQDLAHLREYVDLRLGELEARLQRRIDQVVIRLGVLIVAMTGVLAALIRLFH